MGRSGSTLIERLLGELSEVCSVGEVVHMWRRSLVDDEVCGCGRPFGACDFWHAVGEEAFGGWDRVDAPALLDLKASVDRTRYIPLLIGGRPPAALAERVDRYTDFYDRLYTAVAQVSGSSVIVDSSKHASLAVCLRRRYGDRLRLLHVVRDPRAVAYSWGKRVVRPDATPSSPEKEMARYSPGRAAVQWMVQNAVLAELSRRGTPTRRVRYEDFAADPEREFRAIAEFAGSGGATPIGPDGAARLSPGHTVSGNPLRFSTGEVEVRPDVSWRGGLEPHSRLMVSALTFPARRTFGY
ncbi:sulfotransferase [Nocardiopsis mwathae]|uniref:sulfotransferase n=1 Tax=Nocardiopsis mwathae TaxID=1472723 RepID=UPI0031B5CB05